MRKGTAVLILFLAAVVFAGEDPFAPPANGPRTVDPGWHALVGATVHPRPGETLAGATVVVREGRIVSVSAEPPPAGARVWDLAGQHVYAAFLDPYVPVPAPKPPPGSPGDPWNPLVTPDRSALDGAGLPAETAKALRELGFAAAAIVPEGGVVRGSAAVVSTGEVGPPERPRVLVSRVAAAVSFETVREDSGYPDSLMGAIALLRQSLLDGLVPTDGPLLFDVDDELSVLRAAKVAAEAKRRAVVVGAGTEFRRLDAIRERGVSLVVPLAFPKAPAVASVADRESAELRALMSFEQGPANPRWLDSAGVALALTSSKIPDRSKFTELLQKAIRYGLRPDRALALLTTRPAELLGMEDRVGTIEAGKVANLLVTDAPLFEKGTRIRYLFADGRPHVVRPPRLTGTWMVLAGPAVGLRLSLAFDEDDGLTVSAGERSEKARDVSILGHQVSFGVELGKLGGEGALSITAVRDGEELAGAGVGPGGARFRFLARRASVEPPPSPEWKRDSTEDEAVEVPDLPGYPFGAYALRPEPRAPSHFSVRAGTLWTSGPRGVLHDAVLYVANGKIVKVAGPGAEDLDGVPHDWPVDAPTIDARDLHVTPGIIDCHSHTGISGGVNESGQAVTAEVRIEDVLDPDDVAFYRQLAGGVTVANLLHGSANPIGGQNAVVKFRFGVADPDAMLFSGAPPGIKFALGENVKQSNWGDEFRTRYPQTRMGVETLIRDRFTAAREYEAEWNAWLADSQGHPSPRRDLELEALAEVLDGTRLVHCHSYRQDEILMLCRVAHDFGFRIGTFQHVLEGYKVAEAIKANARGASCFSDWWAFKVEVQDAIPENGPIMHEVGVVVSFNSDSGDLARRLNVEAAKAVKYGGLAPEEALKFVTVNPAIQLGIEDRVGSLEPGKDADFAIWSGDPLSSRSRCLSTWVDGVERFSVESDAEMRRRVAAERERLIGKAMAERDEGGGKKGGGR